MNFTETLNNYINILNCSAKELSVSSNLSETIISRYINGKRAPRINSNQLNQLINGLYSLSLKSNLNITKEEFEEKLISSLSSKTNDFDVFLKNFNFLIDELQLKTNDIAKKTGYDSSFISRIKNGSRKPSNISDFVSHFCDYIIKISDNTLTKNKICGILNCDYDDLKNETFFKNVLIKWMYTFQITKDNNLKDFLAKLDEFNLNTYIKSIHFDTLKVPSIPFYFKNPKNYYGLEEMKNGELDFFKSVIFSKSKEPIFIYNDMPMEDMAKDLDFGKKWMFGIACSLKKGLHLNVIHNLNRPLNEIMLGLESWIPIYMTGQITPYYFKENPNNVFCHTLYVSKGSALIGTGIKNNHSNSKYYLTNKKSEVEFYNILANETLKVASPLMKIYMNDEIKLFNKFLNDEKSNSKNIIIENNNLNNTFKNIKFNICKDKWVSISKNDNPNIHFVIYEKRLVHAISNFIAPIIE